MPTIILKKTFKVKDELLTKTTERFFSLHGSAVTDDTSIVQAINQKLGSIRYVKGGNVMSFKLDAKNHYVANLNHECQKHNEEDIVAAILDVMEIMGWTFKFQYDTQIRTAKTFQVNESDTTGEVFIFNKLNVQKKTNPIRVKTTGTGTTSTSTQPQSLQVPRSTAPLCPAERIDDEEYMS
jgi:hypothetical protein